MTQHKTTQNDAGGRVEMGESGTDGLCYLSAVRKGAQIGVWTALGEWPSVASLVALPEKILVCSDRLVMSVALDGVVAHVRLLGDHEVMESGSFTCEKTQTSLGPVWVVSAPFNFFRNSLLGKKGGAPVPGFYRNLWMRAWCGGSVLHPADDERQVLAKAVPILGEEDAGQTNCVRNLEHVKRGNVAGYNVSRQGKINLLHPRISRLDYEKLAATRLPEQAGYLETLLANMSGVSKQVKARMIATRKAVYQAGPDGTSRIIIVPRVPDAMDEYEVVAEGARDVELEVSPATKDELDARPKTRTYTLTQVFDDHTVLDKYRLTLRQMESVKRLATVNPVEASRSLQMAMNACQTAVNVKIKVGEYVKDKSQARMTLRAVCGRYQAASVSIDAEIVGSEIFLYGPEGRDGWHVRSPTKNIFEATSFYWMVNTEGLEAPVRLLDLETALLGIDVYDGFSYHAEVLEYHVGSPRAPGGVRLPTRVSSGLSTEQNLNVRDMGNRLMPICVGSGFQVATAVRITSEYVLVNAHVLEAEPTCTLAGAPIDLRCGVSRDLMVAAVPGQATPWSLRKPVVGERVAICYLNDGEVVMTSPITVTGFDEVTVHTTASGDVTYGCSGGALVALDDFNLLGVHSSATRNGLLAYRYGEKNFSQLLEMATTNTTSRAEDDGSFAQTVTNDFRKSGVNDVFQKALKSLVPVYSCGRHLGTAVGSGQKLYTACDPDLPLQFGERRQQLEVSDRDAKGLIAFENAGLTSSTPIYKRDAQMGEKVFVLGYDSAPFMTNESRILKIGPVEKYFVLAEIPGLDKSILGGLVMGKDGAALGICGPQSMFTAAGAGYTVWPLPVVARDRTVDVRTTLVLRHPGLDMTEWTDAILEEVFSHSSRGHYDSDTTFNSGCRPLAFAGDGIAKYIVGKTLRDSGMQYSEWATFVQTKLSNAALAQVAWDCGLANHLMVGPNTTFPKSSKAYADIVEAFIGAVALVNGMSACEQVCRDMGLLDFGQSSPSATRTDSV